MSVFLLIVSLKPILFCFSFDCVFMCSLQSGSLFFFLSLSHLFLRTINLNKDGEKSSFLILINHKLKCEMKSRYFMTWATEFTSKLHLLKVVKLHSCIASQHAKLHITIGLAFFSLFLLLFFACLFISNKRKKALIKFHATIASLVQFTLCDSFHSCLCIEKV